MARVYNFSAGPSMLPEKVLRQAQAELLEYGDSGQSVMEMSHRSKWFDAIIKDTEASLRRVMNIPDNYKVGFFQGGATQQFAMGAAELYDHRQGRLHRVRQLLGSGCQGGRQVW